MLSVGILGTTKAVNVQQLVRYNRDDRRVTGIDASATIGKIVGQLIRIVTSVSNHASAHTQEHLDSAEAFERHPPAVVDVREAVVIGKS